jgi:hypothetical protein
VDKQFNLRTCEKKLAITKVDQIVINESKMIFFPKCGFVKLAMKFLILSEIYLGSLKLSVSWY